MLTKQTLNQISGTTRSKPYVASETLGKFGGLQVVTWLIAASLLLTSLIMDHVPRFFQGDSVSYLSTDGTYIPPDRSWAFGFAVNWLLRETGSELAFMSIQLLCLLLVLIICRVFFGNSGLLHKISYAAFVIIVCLDPLIELYARFYMTDLLACLFFIVFLSIMHISLQRPIKEFLKWLPAMVLCVISAVFTRVAYMPILFITMTIILIWSLAFQRSAIPRLITLLTLPIIAAVALVGTNMVVFSNKFPDEVFLTKSSGIMLLGAFAPALTAQDFRDAGVPVLDSEIEALNLPNYINRGAQIWGSDERSAQVLLRRKLSLTEDYPAKLDSVSSQIVLNAALRDPVSFMHVYLVSLALHFQPSEWKQFLVHEAGLDRELPSGFIGYINRIAGPPIQADVTETRSPIMQEFLSIVPLYPFLIIAGILGACWRLLIQSVCASSTIVSAALLAVMVTVPLYTVYVIPRYLIGAIFLTYLVIAELCLGKERPLVRD